jgi:broad-specificity NMP kinase
MRCDARADPPRVDPDPPATVCQACGHRERFLRHPLLCLTGPSGSGKSTVAALLVDRLRERYVVLEQDILWQAGLRDTVGFRATWLAMAAMIGQSGRPVLLCGTVVPPELEPLPERVLFSRIHYLALTCDRGVLAERLRARPAWRQWSEPRIAETLEFNDWVRAEAASMRPPMRLLDSTRATAESIADHVCAWVRECAEPNAPQPNEPQPNEPPARTREAPGASDPSAPPRPRTAESSAPGRAERSESPAPHEPNASAAKPRTPRAPSQ